MKFIIIIYTINSYCRNGRVLHNIGLTYICFHNKGPIAIVYKTNRVPTAIIAVSPLFRKHTYICMWRKCILMHNISGDASLCIFVMQWLQSALSRRGTTGLRPLTSAILAYYSPYYSPYDVTYDVIGNPHYSASYPYVIVDLRVLGLELGLQLEG